MMDFPCTRLTHREKGSLFLFVFKIKFSVYDLQQSGTWNAISNISTTIPHPLLNTLPKLK